MFQIVEIRPVYCSITDGIIGNSAHPRPMAYHSEDLAHKLAGRLEQGDYANCGDNSYVVVEYGKSPFGQRRWPGPAQQEWDDFPF